MYLIDTDIIIYNLKGHPVVRDNFTRRAAQAKAVSVITYGELVFGAHKSRHREKNLSVTHRIADLFRIIDIDRAVMDTFGSLKGGLQRKGSSVDDMDLLIGSTAISHGLTLVTNNVRHFKLIPDLTVENWASGAVD